MKPRRKAQPTEPYSWTYAFIVPLHLYLDDLRDIFNVLEQIGPVLAESDEFVEIASFEELRQRHGKPMRDLTLVATASGGDTVTADFRHNGASITITSPKPEFVGVLRQIQEIAWRHWRNASIADSGWYMAIFLGLIAVASAQSGFGLVPFPRSLLLAGLLFGIAAFILLSSIRQRRSRWTIMPMIWHAERPPSFLKRNQDQIILGLIWVVVGYLLGILTTLQMR
jgi:hypothetical protein